MIWVCVTQLQLNFNKHLKRFSARASAMEWFMLYITRAQQKMKAPNESYSVKGSRLRQRETTKSLGQEKVL